MLVPSALLGSQYISYCSFLTKKHMQQIQPYISCGRGSPLSIIKVAAFSPACEPNINISVIIAARIASNAFMFMQLKYQARLACEGQKILVKFKNVWHTLARAHRTKQARPPNMKKTTWNAWCFRGFFATATVPDAIRWALSRWTNDFGFAE